MPGPYTATLDRNVNTFQYEGNEYSGGTEFRTDNPCKMKGFVNAFIEANPESGIREKTRGVLNDLETECTATVSQVTPQAPPITPPVDVNPNSTGGDTPDQQGAPDPFAGGSVEGVRRTNDNSTTVSSPTEESTRPAEGDPHPTHGGEQPHRQTNAGDPVDIFNGVFYLQETDLEIPNTLLPLAFTRFYRSGAASFGPFGWNWDHNFNLFLRELNTGNMALWRNLHEEVFKFDGANFEPQRGIFEKLERIPALSQVYELKGEGGTIMRFERPAGWTDGERIPIAWLEDRHGNKLRFSYGTEDKLSEVRDDDDRFFRFDYDECGLLVAVSDYSGRKFFYEHDEETLQLVFVKSPSISDHPNGITRIYHYEQPWALPELRHNILRVEDADGNIYLENKYEQDPSSWNYASVTEQLYGGFLYQFRYTQLQWVPANSVYINIPALRVEVMNPDFGLEIYTFNYRGDLLDRRYRLSKDKSYRVVVWQYEFDEQGNLSKTTQPDGSEEINLFDFGNPDPRMRGKLLRKEITSASGFPSPSRILWKGKYEPQYQLLIEEKNETGAATTYKYDFDISPGASSNTGKLIEIIQPAATLPDGTIQTAKTIFEYNSKGQPTASILPDGVKNEIKYGTTGDERSRLVQLIADSGGLNTEERTKYDLWGFASEKTDRNGNITRQIFNALGLQEKVILPEVNGISAEYIFHYNSDKKLISYKRPKGDFTGEDLSEAYIQDNFKRDVLGFPINYELSSNTSESRKFSICNNYRGFPKQIINPDGSKTSLLFDERGLLLGEFIIGPDGKKRRMKETVYDRSGKTTSEFNEFGIKTQYEYDGFSRVSRIILSNGTTIHYKWLPGDLLESIELTGDDGSGSIRQLKFRSYAYDEKGRKISETIKAFTNDPGNYTDIKTTFFYDTMDRVVSIINNRGGISTKCYDTLGRLTTETDTMGNEEHYIYDNNGNHVQTASHHREPDGSVSVFTKRFAYDSRNRKTAMIEPDGAKVISKYDDRDLLVSLTDQQGIIKQLFYDAFNNKIKEMEDSGGLNITKRWTIDKMSRITSFIDPMGQTSRYVFDSVGHPIRMDYPNGFTNTRFFNDNNQIIKEQLGSGATFTYAYDTSNRIIKIENTAFPAPLIKVDTHEFAYDGLNRVLSAKAGNSIIQRKYDSQDRLLEETAHSNTISCAYNDTTGEVEKIWPDGRTEKLSHDLNGIVTRIEETANGILGSGNALLAAFKPSGANSFGEATYNEDVLIRNSYDERKRLTKIIATHPAGLNESIHYRYNTSNLKQAEVFSGQNPKISFFEFDNKYRLLKARDGFASSVPDAINQAEHDLAIAVIQGSSSLATHQESFLYNPSDARTQYSETGSPDKNYTFQPGYRIQNDGANTYTHFTEGTLRSDGTFIYEVDSLGRILKIKSGSAIVTEIIYDAFGRPDIIKENGKPDKSFHYFGGFVEQENENGQAVRQISLHPVTGIPIAYHSASGTHYTLFDGRFNLVALLDNNGNLAESYRYKSFGLPEIFNPTGGIIENSAFGIGPIYGGQRYLSESKLYLSKRRLMNPVNGVFLSADPKGYVDSSSLYIYSGQDPINNIDPNGEIIPFIIAAFVIGGALAGAGYSVYDAYHHPEKYEGWGGTARIFGNVFGGAAIGGLAIVGGELVLAAGGTGIFATGAGATATATTLTTTQTFALYGTAAATTGAAGRSGFNSLFPEYIDPVSTETIATDYILGGALSVAAPIVRQAAEPLVSGGRQMFSRAIGGNWRAFGNTRTLLRKGYSSSSRLQYGLGRLFWNNRPFSSVSRQYWSQSVGRANGKALHHLFFQNQSQWVPQGLRNAGFNLLEIPAPLNTWMGGRLGRELAFRGIVSGILTTTGYSSYKITDTLLNSGTNTSEAETRSNLYDRQSHPNEKSPSSK